MNVLVTNTRNAQAYGVIRSLRPGARTIVATPEGTSRWSASLSHAALSRLVDRRYHVPSPSADWRAGRYDVFLRQMDTLEVIRVAEALGFPCPRTALASDGDGLAALEREVGYPLVVKPRSASGSRGVALVPDRAALLRPSSAAGVPPEWRLVHEDGPGSQSGRFASYWVVLDRDARAVVGAGHVRVRSVFRDLAAQGAVWAALDDPTLARAGARLCAALGLAGVALVQAKRDPRDDRWKLIEVNPRPLVSLAWWGACAVATLEHRRARGRAGRRRPAPAALPVAP